MAVRARAVEIERLYTIDEFEQMPEFSENYELIDGRLVKKPMPGRRHGRIADDLLKAFWLFDMREKLGKAWREVTVKVRPDELNGRIPDLYYVVGSRIPPETDLSLDVVPDLVVEVWSPSDIAGQKALESTPLKMRYWPTSGVRITWCINPAAQEVEVLYADPTKSTIIQGFEGELNGEDVLPAFKLKVSELFS